MKFKRWLRSFFLASFVVLTIIAAINFHLDNAGLFQPLDAKLYSEPNQNFLKMEYLLKKEHTFDSFIFGSSRVKDINPRAINNGNYYNMTYAEGLPLEHLANIKLLLKNNIPIKNILLGLDDFSYEVNPVEHLNAPSRASHFKSDINTMSKFSFYTKYLLHLPSKNDFMNIYKRDIISEVQPNLEYNIVTTGTLSTPKYLTEGIEKNITKHRNDVKFTKPFHYEGYRMQATLDEIAQIITLSQKHDINCTVFINPIHYVTYLDTNFTNFQEFKYKLAHLSNYYDFSGLNRITTDNYYYYETSHYRHMVGDLIIEKIFKQNKKHENSDFGVYVTKKTIDTHLKNLRAQRTK